MQKHIFPSACSAATKEGDGERGREGRRGQVGRHATGAECDAVTSSNPREMRKVWSSGGSGGSAVASEVRNAKMSRNVGALLDGLVSCCSRAADLHCVHKLLDGFASPFALPRCTHQNPRHTQTLAACRCLFALRTSSPCRWSPVRQRAERERFN